MILHNVMWESRPLPKIVRDPLAAHSARGAFFVPAPPGIFCFGDGRQAPGDLKREKLAGRETFLEKGSPSPYPSLPKTFAGGPVQKSVTLGRYGRECSYSIVTTFRYFGCNLLRLLKMFCSLCTDWTHNNCQAFLDQLILQISGFAEAGEAPKAWWTAVS